MPTSRHPADLSTFRLRRRTPGPFILVPCSAEGRSIRCQGHLEADAALTLSACPRLAWFREQPFVVWYAWRPAPGGCQIHLLDGPPARRPRKTDPVRVTYVIPDFLVVLADGPERLLEVKPSRKLADPVVQRKLAVARLFADGRGWPFHVLTERELRGGPLLGNLRLLRRYRRLNPDPAIIRALTEQVAAGGTRLGELLRRAEGAVPPPVLYQHALHLLGAGLLSFDPCARPLDNDSSLFPKGAVLWDPFASAWAPSGCLTAAPSACSTSPPPTGSSPST
jgi:hypothetical protein